jgi:hypothetical protein
VLAWLIAGVRINIFVVALFFFGWCWAAQRRAAVAWELEEVEVVWCAREVELHVELGDKPVATAFEVREASSRVVAARQLKDVEATRRTREGDRAATVMFEVEEASSRAASELKGVEATRRKAVAVRELEEGDRVTTVFEVRDASSRAAQGGSSFDDILYLREELEASFSHCMAAVDIEFDNDSCDEQ